MRKTSPTIWEQATLAVPEFEKVIKKLAIKREIPRNRFPVKVKVSNIQI